MKKNMLILLVICLFSCAYAQDSSWDSRQLSQYELNNISVLSECYGYVRFFYPNPHTKDMDWIKFLMYSVAKIENVTNDDDLKIRLLELFSPICPQISFSTDSMVSTEKLTPPYYAIEHKAIGTLTKMVGKKYSPIIQITDNLDYQDMYSYPLKENLYVNFPVAVKRLPAKTKEFTALKKELNKINDGGISLFTAWFNRKKAVKSNFLWQQSAFRIADVIVRRNYVRHFYPYFSEDGLDENWDLECMKTVEYVARSNMVDYYMAICRLLANMKDSHVNIWSNINFGKSVGGYLNYYYPDISLSVVNDTCFVDFVGQEYENGIKRGDIVSSIDTVPIENVIQDKLLEIPHSTQSNGLYVMSIRGKLLAFILKKGSVDITTVSQDNIETTTQVNANLNKPPYQSKNDFIQLLDNGIIYINLCSDSCTYTNFAKSIPIVQDSRGVIFDMRGYPRYDVLSIISHFIKDKIELGNLLEPIYCFPNQEKVKYETSEKWYVYPAVSPESKEASKKYEYKEPQPIQIDKPVVFLIDGKNMSFGETFAEMMKFHKVGTLVGTHTAGCNGDATQLSMPCFTFFMTYAKFLNRDGSQHHGIGVLPDVHCEMQLSDIRNNMDTQLEKAKEFLR